VQQETNHIKFLESAAVTGINSTEQQHSSRLCGAAEPNHSVNLTRNSVPHLPGSARYAHNALPGKRVTLPRAGYLRR
jgi:hypothetical protein